MHLTLTVPNVDYAGPVRGMMRDLMLSFRRLRRMKLWRENVTGGAYGMEVTDKGQGYHPHLHVVIDCRWLALVTPEPRRADSPDKVKALLRGAAEELQAAWQHATGAERHLSIWLRRCDSNAASEILKYALKSEDAVKLKGRLGEVFRAMDAVRMCAAFGSCRGVELPEDDTPKLTCPNGHQSWQMKETVGAQELEARREEFRAKMRRWREAEVKKARAEWQAFARIYGASAMARTEEETVAAIRV